MVEEQKSATLGDAHATITLCCMRTKKNRWVHLAGLPLTESGGRGDILLGLDHANLMLAKQYREGRNPEEPSGIKTRLEWVVRGVMSPRKNTCHGRVNFLQRDKPWLDHLFKTFMTTEGFGTEYQGTSS